MRGVEASFFISSKSAVDSTVLQAEWKTWPGDLMLDGYKSHIFADNRGGQKRYTMEFHKTNKIYYSWQYSQLSLGVISPKFSPILREVLFFQFSGAVAG